MIHCTIKVICFLLLSSLLLSTSASAQSQEEIDSLAAIYERGDFAPEDELSILRSLSYDADPQKILKYSELLIERSKTMDSSSYLYTGYLNRGQAYQMTSDFTQALENFFLAASVAEEENDRKDLGRVHISIADVYSNRGNHDKAVQYYRKAGVMLKEEGDSLGIAIALENLGDEYLIVEMPDSALFFFNESGLILNALNSTTNIPINTGNKGIAYAMLGKEDSAKHLINKAVTQLELMEDYYPIPTYLFYMSDIYLNQDNWTVALSYAQRSLDIAKKYGLKDQIRDANLKLSELYEMKGDFRNSLIHYRNYAIYKDSVQDIQTVQQMANLRADFEIAQQKIQSDARIDLLNQQKRNQTIIVIMVAIVSALLAVLAIGLYRRNRFVERTSKIIEAEKGRSDRLLRNILPDETAEELKEYGKVKARRFESVSVLFADFKGFTLLSDKMSPEELVTSVDYYFSKFDQIIEKYGVEKIKTMGDAYMCVCGLPDPLEDHAARLTDAAFEMAAFMEETRRTQEGYITQFELRIGINTGPVVAGVVGTKKFVYDIWGDTVNIAARMESNSVPGRINVSENTYQEIKDIFECTSRGEIDVKNKGMMAMYFVDRKIKVGENEKSDISMKEYSK